MAGIQTQFLPSSLKEENFGALVLVTCYGFA
jgi:hypothetical protein